MDIISLDPRNAQLPRCRAVLPYQLMQFMMQTIEEQSQIHHLEYAELPSYESLFMPKENLCAGKGLHGGILWRFLRKQKNAATAKRCTMPPRLRRIDLAIPGKRPAGNGTLYCTNPTSFWFQDGHLLSRRASADLTESELTSKQVPWDKKKEGQKSWRLQQKSSEQRSLEWSSGYPWVKIPHHQIQKLSPDGAPPIGPPTKVCSSRFPSSLLFWSAHLWRKVSSSKVSSKKLAAPKEGLELLKIVEQIVAISTLLSW